MKNILVAIDLDKEATIIIEKAKELAKAFDSKIWLLHIIEPTPNFIDYQVNEHFIVGPQYVRTLDEDKKTEEQKNLQEKADKLIKDGINAEGITIIGPTIEMIIEETETIKADLIVIGNHRHGFLYEALIGDTTSKIIKQSKIPIFVVPL